MTARLPDALPASLIALLAVAVLLMGGTGPVVAQEAPKSPPTSGQAQENLDQIISGFDDKPSLEGTEKGAEKGTGEAAQPDLESGFQDTADEAAAQQEPVPQAEPSLFSLNGFLRLDSSYNFSHDPPTPGAPPPQGTDFQGLSKLRLVLQLELTLDFSRDWEGFVSGQANRDFIYAMKGRETYTQGVLDTYEQESELREVYLQGSPIAELDIKLGRQIVVWGKSDNIRVTDVLNPIDNREPGVVDIEDIRLPLTMSRLDYFFGGWSLGAIAVHEVRFNKDPVFGSDFFPFGSLPPPERVPEDGGSNTEFALALSGIFSGYDLAFYWARIFDDAAHLVSLTGPPNADSCSVPGGCELRHSRLTMAGVAYNIAVGSWLWKTEAALFKGLEFFQRPGEQFSRLDFLVGFEYVPIPDSTISFEAVDRMILDYKAELENPPDNTRRNVNQYVVSYRADLLRQQLHVVALAIFFGREAGQGSVRRLSATYDLFDAFSVTGGVVTYHAGNFILDTAQDNDRLFFDAKYSF